MKSQLSWDRFFMGVAVLSADLSYDPKTKVGAVITRDGNILSFSYNGTPSGTNNNTRDGNMETLPEVLHAETNALGKMMRAGISTAGCTLYSTREPCIHCAKLIYQAGIRRVVFHERHSNPEGTYFLFDREILVEMI